MKSLALLGLLQAATCYQLGGRGGSEMDLGGFGYVGAALRGRVRVTPTRTQPKP